MSWSDLQTRNEKWKILRNTVYIRINWKMLKWKMKSNEKYCELYISSCYTYRDNNRNDSSLRLLLLMLFTNIYNVRNDALTITKGNHFSNMYSYVQHNGRVYRKGRLSKTYVIFNSTKWTILHVCSTDIRHITLLLKSSRPENIFTN